MKKLFFIVALMFSMNASAFRVFNSQIGDFKKITNRYYSCIVKLQNTEVEVIVTKDLMTLIKSNRVSLNLKWANCGHDGIKFYLIPTFKNEPR
jgi:hypothetical protein